MSVSLVPLVQEELVVLADTWKDLWWTVLRVLTVLVPSVFIGSAVKAQVKHMVILHIGIVRRHTVGGGVAA